MYYRKRKVSLKFTKFVRNLKAFSREPVRRWRYRAREGLRGRDARLFYFYIFQKKITEIYFGFQNLQFYTPTARQGGGRGPTAPLLGGRDLFANKNKIYLRINPWWGPKKNFSMIFN